MEPLYEEPISKFPKFRQNYQQSFAQSAISPSTSGANVNNSNSANKGEAIGKKSRYSLNFNKGVPCKFGAKCRFIECCSYCDAGDHGVHECKKLKVKEAHEAKAQ